MYFREVYDCGFLSVLLVSAVSIFTEFLCYGTSQQNNCDTRPPGLEATTSAPDYVPL